MSDVVDEAIRTEWGLNIEARRKKCGYDRFAFADALGVRYPTVHRWEAGKFAPRDAMKVKIARVLRTDVRTLFPLIVTEAAS